MKVRLAPTTGRGGSGIVIVILFRNEERLGSRT